MKETQFGDYIQSHRVAAELSLRAVAAVMGLSHVFLGEVERGRKTLPESRWAALVRAIPSLSLKGLREAAAADLKAQGSLQMTTFDYKNLNDALARRIAGQGLDEATYKRIMKLIGSEGQ